MSFKACLQLKETAIIKHCKLPSATTQFFIPSSWFKVFGCGGGSNGGDDDGSGGGPPGGGGNPEGPHEEEGDGSPISIGK